MKRSIVFIAALALLLAGCGNKEPSAATGPTQSADGSAPTTEPIISGTRPTDGIQPTDPSGEQPKKTIYVRTASTTSSGTSMIRTEYFFDERECLSQVKIYTNGTLTQQYDVDCDAYGNYIRWTGESSRIEYSYDGYGNPLGQRSYIGNMLISETVYTWSGRLRTGITTRMPAQGLEHRSVLTYNDSGQLIRQDQYDGGTLAGYCLYVNGEDGRAVTATSYRVDGTLEQTIQYSYDELLTVATVTDADGALLQTTERITDENGNITSVTSYDAEGKMLTQETHSWKAVEVAQDSLRAEI